MIKHYREAMYNTTENHKQEITSNHEKNAFNTVIESGSQIVVVHEWMTYKEAYTIHSESLGKEERKDLKLL